MNIQPLLHATCGTLATFLCFAQGGFAQPSLQISHNGIVMRSESAPRLMNFGKPSAGSPHRTLENWRVRFVQRTPEEPMQNPSSNFSSNFSSNRSQVNLSQTSQVSQTRVSSTQQSTQRTSITLAAAALKQPYQLTISAPGLQLSGQIKVNGQVIQTLKGARTSFNLAPYLSKGTKIVEINGHYSPMNAPVKIEFSGTGTRVLHQTSGNGRLNQILAIVVR